jgi:hypothetical protein
VEELNEGGRLAQRILGFRPSAEPPRPSGFPPGFVPPDFTALDHEAGGEA